MMTSDFPRRGDVYLMSFADIHAQTPDRRLVLIVSNNTANATLNRVHVLPLSPTVSRIFPCEASLTVADQQYKAMADQLTATLKSRLTHRVQAISPDELHAVDNAIRVHFSLYEI